MSTYFPKEGEIARKWYVVDASEMALGRLASKVARILMGKESPKYTPFLDTGDHVVVINAEKVKISGMKSEQKVYHRYTGYPGGLRSEDYRKRFDRKPELIIKNRGAQLPQRWHMPANSRSTAGKNIPTKHKSQKRCRWRKQIEFRY
jgi:large subunit ribosomal protein L13